MTPRHHKLFYGSSYDRGLIHLLKMWPKIKETVSNAELHIAYGWDLFDRAYADNPERQAWKERMNKLMEQPGITHHGRVSKDRLKELERECGIWAYPTDFGETCCITALDCQAQGCVPVVINYAGLRETVQSGMPVEGDIYDEETQEVYLKSLLNMMSNEEYWKSCQVVGEKWAKQWNWKNVAAKWLEAMEGGAEYVIR